MVKSPELIERMRVAGRMAAEVLRVTGDAVRVGITTDELDAICHAATIERGAYPSPLNYHGYPKSLCTSVNEVICHGIPDSRPLADGDIVNLDVTVYLDGVHGDTNATFGVGTVDAESQRLITRHQGVPRTRHCGRRAGTTDQRHRPGHPTPRRSRRVRRRPRLLRSRHRRGVPPPGPADPPLLRAVRRTSSSPA